ncbi:hypothetical protein J1614_005241 [Plenodomus biglobosus]|nr:hypothetical protein J1614_005241 [Plenodomus biglobosus]
MHPLGSEPVSPEFDAGRDLETAQQTPFRANKQETGYKGAESFGAPRRIEDARPLTMAVKMDTGSPLKKMHEDIWDWNSNVQAVVPILLHQGLGRCDEM